MVATRQRFEREVVPHLGAAYTLARHLLGYRAEAEDAVQDAFLRAYRAFSQMRGPNAKAWLLTIVRNVCYRRLEQRHRGANVVSLDEALLADAATGERGLGGPEQTPEAYLIAAGDARVVQAALSALPPAFREVIVLREIEELGYREIADVIGAPIGTVMSRLSRARAQLRVELTRVFDEEDKNAV